MVGLGQQRFEFAQLGLHGVDMAERALRNANQRTPAVEMRFLGQIRDAQTTRLADIALGRVFDIGDHLDQRRLAGAVRPDQRDLVAAIHHKADAFEDAVGTIPFR